MIVRHRLVLANGNRRWIQGHMTAAGWDETDAEGYRVEVTFADVGTEGVIEGARLRREAGRRSRQQAVAQIARGQHCPALRACSFRSAAKQKVEASSPHRRQGRQTSARAA